MDPEKVDRLSNSVCQTLGIKIARTADISSHHSLVTTNHTHKVSPKHSPVSTNKLTNNKPHQHHHQSPKLSSPKSSIKSPPLTNGFRESPKNSPSSSLSVKPSPVPPIKISTSLSSAAPKSKVQESKTVKSKVGQERSLDPIKISIPSGSIIRYANLKYFLKTNLKYFLQVQ